MHSFYFYNQSTGKRREKILQKLCGNKQICFPNGHCRLYFSYKHYYFFSHKHYYKLFDVFLFNFLLKYKNIKVNVFTLQCGIPWVIIFLWAPRKTDTCQLKPRWSLFWRGLNVNQWLVTWISIFLQRRATYWL